MDIAYKRFEEEDYEWEEKSVKVHVVEPDMDIREEKQITAMLAHVDAVAVFLGTSCFSVILFIALSKFLFLGQLWGSVNLFVWPMICLSDMAIRVNISQNEFLISEKHDWMNDLQIVKSE